MLIDNIGLWGLFGSAYLASTLLPGGSEVVLAALAVQQTHSDLALLSVATVGNTLGGMTSWLMGWWLARRFPGRALDEAKHGAALRRVRRWGSPVLLLSWLPVVGDPLCLVAGWLRLHPLKSALFIAAGKAARYAAILWLA